MNGKNIKMNAARGEETESEIVSNKCLAHLSSSQCVNLFCMQALKITDFDSEGEKD